MKKQVAERIRAARRVAVSSHLRPDADAVGSGLALCLMLRRLGLQADFINVDRAPSPVDRLPGYALVRHGQIHPQAYDLVVLIEGGNEERTGQEHLQRYDRLLIDHHLPSGDDGPPLAWVVPEAAAVGELVYDLALELGVELDRDIAFNLFAAIASDTGSFKYSNTTARSLAVAADLARRGGFPPFEVSNLLFNSNPPEKIRMLTRVLSTLETALDGRVAMIHFRREFLDRLSLKEIETEDVIAVARSIDGVQVLLFFKEIEPDYYRVSVRSRGGFSARRVAQAFGGDGHHHAAGFFYRGALAGARDEVVRLVAGQLSP